MVKDIHHLHDRADNTSSHIPLAGRLTCIEVEVTEDITPPRIRTVNWKKCDTELCQDTVNHLLPNFHLNDGVQIGAVMETITEVLIYAAQHCAPKGVERRCLQGYGLKQRSSAGME